MLAVANARSGVMAALNNVCGARLIADLAALPVPLLLVPDSASRAVPPSDDATVGSDLTTLAYCASELENTAPIMSPTFKLVRARRRDGSGGGTSRGTGVTSRMALASTVPPLPSSAAWWILE